MWVVYVWAYYMCSKKYMLPYMWTYMGSKNHIHFVLCHMCYCIIFVCPYVVTYIDLYECQFLYVRIRVLKNSTYISLMTYMLPYMWTYTNSKILVLCHICYYIMWLHKVKASLWTCFIWISWPFYCIWTCMTLCETRQTFVAFFEPSKKATHK